MARARTTAVAGVLVVQAELAVLGVLFHYSFTTEYGDVTDLAKGSSSTDECHLAGGSCSVGQQVPSPSWRVR